MVVPKEVLQKDSKKTGTSWEAVKSEALKLIRVDEERAQLLASGTLVLK